MSIRGNIEAWAKPPPTDDHPHPTQGGIGLEGSFGVLDGLHGVHKSSWITPRDIPVPVGSYAQPFQLA
ncbi:hypothetical protein N7468_009297 [Penicillium chermesinum]|uniref:Uncharacterized protein n=1 Tax=Penicillium chermesinum TaxID=63820 RepID=A0A9W9NHV9_9EURO|nr:uncharacterized protein N7468_009297 [Penicillium chermesinum]KAJ5220093.1 hypothetical protein N7468_009297 [Penicillium chermesinum]